MATRKIETEIVLGGEKEFNQAMTAVNSNLKTLKTDMALVTAQFDDNAQSMEALTEKQKVLDSITDQHRAKVAALAERYEEVKRVNGENAAATDKARQALNQATVDMLKAEKQARQNAAAMDQLKADEIAAAAAIEEAARAAEEKARADAEAAEAAEKQRIADEAAAAAMEAQAKAAAEAAEAAEKQKQFNSEISGADSNIKILRAEMDALALAYENNGDSVAALSDKQNLLEAIAAESASKVDTLKARYDELASATETDADALNKLLVEISQASLESQKAAKAAQQNADALEAAKKAANTYTPITQRAATAVQGFGTKIKDTVSGVKEAAHHVPVLGEALDVAGVAGKAAKTGLHAAGTAVKAVGTASAAAAKGVATASAAMAKGFATVATGAAKGLAVATAAAAALGTAALTTMVSFAKESAEAAQAASDAGEQLSASQEKWLAYSQSLSGLEASAASAKGALAGVLLPVLGDLSTQGAQFLNDFTADMEAAGTDTKAQTQVITDYIVKGASMIKEALPEYIAAAKDILGGLAEGLGEAGPELIDMGLDIVMELVDGIASASPAMAEGAIDLLNKLVSGLGKRAPELTKAALGMVKALLGGLTQNGSTMMDGAKELVTALIQGLGDEGPEILDMGMDLVVDLLDGIIEAAPQLAETAVDLIGHLIQGLTEKGPDLLTSAAGMVADLVSGLAQAAPQMIPAATQLVTQLLTTLIESAPQLLSAGVELVLGIIEGIFNSLGDIGNAVDSIVSTFVDAMANSDSAFLQVGANMIKGIWNGITNATEWLYGLLSGWVNDVVGWIQEKFKINSPSKLMASKVGAPMAEGIGYGFKREMRVVNAQLADSIDTSFDVPRPGSNRRARTVAATTAGGKVVNLTIYTQKLSDADVAMLLDYVNQKFGEEI